MGKVDAAADRRTRVLRVAAVHQDEPFTQSVSAAVTAEIEDLATWLGMDLELSR